MEYQVKILNTLLTVGSSIIPLSLWEVGFCMERLTGSVFQTSGVIVIGGRPKIKRIEAHLLFVEAYMDGDLSFKLPKTWWIRVSDLIMRSWIASHQENTGRTQIDVVGLRIPSTRFHDEQRRGEWNINRYWLLTRSLSLCCWALIDFVSSRNTSGGREYSTELYHSYLSFSTKCRSLQLNLAKQIEICFSHVMIICWNRDSDCCYIWYVGAAIFQAMEPLKRYSIWSARKMLSERAEASPLHDVSHSSWTMPRIGRRVIGSLLTNRSS